MNADKPKPGAGCARPLFEEHPRRFAENRYVYPVLSRRAGGISIGVNLNRDRTCNFRCVYCQVDRESPPLPDASDPIDLARLAEELDAMVAAVQSGRLFEGPRFGTTPPPLRRLNDIALSGDGEPTLCPQFAEAVEVCAQVRRRHGLDDVKLVLITNASLLDRPRVRRGLAVLDASNGEIWAKLDAGTEDGYRRIARSHVPFSTILGNLLEAARVRPIVIQTLLMRLDGQPPSAAELAAYSRRLTDLIAAGGQIKLVQLHTVARRPAEPYVSPLARAELDAAAEHVRRETGLPVMVVHAEQA